MCSDACRIKNVRTFVTAKQRGVLVQLVRMPPCHGGGHGFESHTHRKKESPNGGSFLRVYGYTLKKLYIFADRIWVSVESDLIGNTGETPGQSRCCISPDTVSG